MTFLDKLNNEAKAMVGTFVSIKIADADDLIEGTEPTRWNADFALFLDVIFKDIDDNVSVINIGYDGVILMFNESKNAAIAINFIIEKMDHFDTTPIRDDVKISINVGIAYGEVKRISLDVEVGEESNKNVYLGSPIMLAKKLSEIGASRALFLDEETQQAGNMSLISSDTGKRKNWKGRQYLSEEKSVKISGYPQTVSFVDVKWDGNSHGVRVESGIDKAETKLSVDKTDVVDQNRNGNHAQTFESKPFDKLEQIRGRISNVQNDKGFAFIEADDGQSYFAHFNEFLDNLEVRRGDVVFFYGQALAPGKTNPSAASIMTVGNEYEGVVRNITEKYCFIEVEQVGKDSHDIFYFHGGMDKGVEIDRKGKMVLEENFNKKANAYKPSTRKVIWR